MIDTNKTKIVISRSQEALEEVESLVLRDVGGVACEIRKARVDRTQTSLRPKSHERLGLIDQLNVVHEIGRVHRRFRAPLTLIVHEEESFVLHDRPAQSGAELILP